MFSVTTSRGTWTTPEWLSIDLLLVDLLDEWEAGLCPGCGDPMTSHAGKTYRDYASAAVTCPAVIAQDKAQVAAAKKAGNKDAKEDPSRSRFWVLGPRRFIHDYTAAVKAALTPEESNG